MGWSILTSSRALWRGKSVSRVDRRLSAASLLLVTRTATTMRLRCPASSYWRIKRLLLMSEYRRLQKKAQRKSIRLSLHRRKSFISCLSFPCKSWARCKLPMVNWTSSSDLSVVPSLLRIVSDRLPRPLRKFQRGSGRKKTATIPISRSRSWKMRIVWLTSRKTYLKH